MERFMLCGFRRMAEMRVRNPCRQFGSARVPAGPCARRLHTLPAAWCETLPGHRWRARWVCRGAKVLGADDLRFLRPLGGAAERVRRLSIFSPAIPQRGSFL